MTSTEQLIEAVTYASDNDFTWYDMFDSKSEALKAINAALKERPDESQVVCLLSAREANEDMFEFCTAEHAYKDELKIMKKELRDYV